MGQEALHYLIDSHQTLLHADHTDNAPDLFKNN